MSPSGAPNYGEGIMVDITAETIVGTTGRLVGETAGTTRTPPPADVIKMTPAAPVWTGVDRRTHSAAWRQLKSLWPVLVLVLVVIVAVFASWQLVNGPDTTNWVKITTGFSVVLAVILSMFPAVLCTVQNVSLQRQQAELKSMENTPAAGTTLYQTAVRIIGADDRDAFIDNDYIVPILSYFVVSIVGFIAMFLGYGLKDLFAQPTVLLGGLMEIDLNNTAPYVLFQRQTFAVVSMAFVGAYAYSLGRILDRINNNDLYPISLYYYATRIIIACVVAAVLRHTISAFGTFPESWLMLLGFIVGFAPDLFIIAMSRKAFQAMKVWGSRPDPNDAALPVGLPMLMIDDLTREKIDRLNELGIDSAQVLARQNPFLLLPRLPFELSLLNDWIAQAQLYVFAREEKLKALRAIYVNDIIDLYVRLKNPDSSAAVCDTLGREAKESGALLQQLEDNVDFTRLLELVRALKVEVK